MIDVRVGDEDVRDRFAAHRIENGFRMRRIVRSRIDHRDLASADDVAKRSREAERPGIVAENPPQARHHLLDHACLQREILVEANIFVAHLVVL